MRRVTRPAPGSPTGPAGPPPPPEDPAGRAEADAPEAEPAQTPEVESPAPPAPALDLGAEEIAAIAARSGTRRAPRVARFIWAGALVGVLVAAFAAVLGPDGDVLGRGAIFLLLAVFLGSGGALLGALVAVGADRRSVRAAASGRASATGASSGAESPSPSRQTGRPPTGR